MRFVAAFKKMFFFINHDVLSVVLNGMIFNWSTLRNWAQ